MTTVRRVGPTDNWILDDNGEVIGVQQDNGGAQQFFGVLATDPLTGAVTGLVGPGGVIFANLPCSVQSSMTVMGDSLAAMGHDKDIGSLSQGPLGWLNDLLNAAGCGFDVVNMLAAGGQTIDTTISTYLPLAIADGSDCVWLHTGANNLSSGGTNDTIPALLTKYQTLISSLSASKRLIFVDSILPVLQSGTTLTKTRAAQFQTINAGISQICAKFPNVIYIDDYSSLIDKTSAVLNPVTGYLRPDDGIHYQTIGAQVAGYAREKLLQNKVRINKYKTVGVNLLPAFSGTGGTVSAASGSITGAANIPAGWNIQLVSGIAGQVIAVSTFAPDSIRFTVTNSSATNLVCFIQVFPNSQLAMALNSGALVQGSFGFQMTGITAAVRCALQLAATGAVFQCPGNPSTPTSWFAMNKSIANEPNLTYPTTNHGGVRMTPPANLTAGATLFQYVIVLEVAATTGACVLDISNPQLNTLS